MSNEISNLLIDWFRHNKRDLPWRHTNNPYLIWVSEVILQQTRVVQGLPYYYRFTEAFPTVAHLAQAPPDGVLKVWQGLGYYSRARNMHATAKLIYESDKGEFPKNYSELLQLKGIGPYTAAAIASFAYNEPVAVVDGNVMRVLARIFKYENNITTHLAQKELQTLANHLLNTASPGVHNQAMMELGALVCTPANPNCLVCPIQAHCQAFAHKIQAQLPIKIKKNTVKNRNIHYLILHNDRYVLMKKRTKKDIWQQLWDFVEIDENENWHEENLIKYLRTKHLLNPSPKFIQHYQTKHILSHRTLHLHFWKVYAKNLTEYAAPFSATELSMADAAQLPMPLPVANYFKDFLHNQSHD